MKFTTSYLKGNTIIEVLIALAITSFCASLAVIIHINIQKSSLPFFKIKAMELAQAHLRETLQQKTFFDETYKEETFTVKKSITGHVFFPDCYVIRMIVFDGEKRKIIELEASAYSKK